jgi:hypothetical protein
MLEKETAYYQAHRTSLREKYAGKRVVIAGDQIQLFKRTVRGKTNKIR